MRFTRPGARPCQLDLEGTKLRGRVLCPGVEDERARAELRPREVLELVAGPVRRIELEVEVMLSAGAARRFLMHRHHIGERLFGEGGGFFVETPFGARGRVCFPPR